MGELVRRRTEPQAIAAPGANTNILSASLTPGACSYRFRVEVTLAVGSIFDFTETLSGTTRTHSLNSGVPLDADEPATFEHAVRQDATYNYRVKTDGAINRLMVEELHA